jgi:O-methyltransferase involved in polyketide biosynthesis
MPAHHRGCLDWLLVRAGRRPGCRRWPGELHHAAFPAWYARAVPDDGQVAFDASRPSVARIYDYWLGGKDNFAADREEAERVLAVYPPLVQMVRENRLFLSRSVSWLASEGIRQFLDIGSGLPTSHNTHEVAQAVDPGCRVAYVDSDPVVLSHGNALLRGDGVAIVAGDLREPKEIIESTAVRELIRPDEPTAVVLALVMHFLDPDVARRVTRQLIDWLASGSYLVICTASADEEVATEMRREYTASSTWNHSRDVIRGFFDGTELVPPGLTDARDWVPGAPAQPLAPKAVRALAGVGRKP